MKLTKHWHYLIVLLGLFAIDVFVSDGLPSSSSFKFILLAMIGFGMIAVIIAWISFGISNKKDKKNIKNQNYSEEIGFNLKNDNQYQKFLNNIQFSKNEKPIEILNDDLKILKLKPWYRLLQIFYVMAFCVSVYFLLTIIYKNINPPKIIFDNEKTIITCDNGDYSSANDLGVDLNSKSFLGLRTSGEVLKDSKGGGLLSHKETANSSYPLLKFCNPNMHLLDNNINNNYTIDFKYKSGWNKFAFYLIGGLLSLVVIFEFLRQLGYYVFLGKMHPSWLISKLIKIWK